MAPPCPVYFILSEYWFVRVTINVSLIRLDKRRRILMKKKHSLHIDKMIVSFWDSLFVSIYDLLSWNYSFLATIKEVQSEI